MRQVGSFEAKTQLSRLLRDVERGETIEILRNGHPIARIVPVCRDAGRTPREALEHLLSSQATLRGASIRALRDEGRRT